MSTYPGVEFIGGGEGGSKIKMFSIKVEMYVHFVGSTLPKIRIIRKKRLIKSYPELNLLAFLQFQTNTIFNR